MKSEILNITDASKYVDFFGFSESGSIANSMINEMLDQIERNYDKASMPYIMQMMIYSSECPHCQKSLPVWKKLGNALATRLRKYHYGMAEINDVIEISGTQLSGAKLYKVFGAKGVPFFIQNFKVQDLIKNKSVRIKELAPSEFWNVSEGELQPFHFLAASFNVKNLFVESKLSTSLNTSIY